MTEFGANAGGLRGQMWLYSDEATLCGIAPGVNSASLEQDAYFSALYSRKLHFLNVDNDFTSIATTLRTQRDDNGRIRRLKADFLDDFNVDIRDYDDDEFEADPGY